MTTGGPSSTAPSGPWRRWAGPPLVQAAAEKLPPVTCTHMRAHTHIHKHTQTYTCTHAHTNTYTHKHPQTHSKHVANTQTQPTHNATHKALENTHKCMHTNTNQGTQHPASAPQLSQLHPIDLSKLSFVGEALKNLRAEVGGAAAVLGFVGAPWTLATYLVEVRSGRGLSEVGPPDQHRTGAVPVRLQTTALRLPDCCSPILVQQICEFRMGGVYRGAGCFCFFVSASMRSLGLVVQGFGYRVWIERMVTLRHRSWC